MLACQTSNIFSAIAPISDCMMTYIFGFYALSVSILILEIRGINDNMIWWRGNPNDLSGWGPCLYFNLWYLLIKII
mgnify:CR=1 FL=1